MINSSNVGFVLNVVGWFFLAMSWLVPYVMKKVSACDKGENHVMGAVLSAVAIGLFIGSIVVTVFI
jgi:hypothetical protein